MTGDEQPGKGPARGYTWEPFEPGHEKSLHHGARSERQIGPLPVEIEQAARADAAWPDYLDDPSYSGAVTAWARSEAMAELVFRYLADRDIAAALTALEETDEQSEMTGGRGRRITSTRRTTAALDAFHRAQSAAAGHRRSLGLDPLSRARLGRDVVAAEAMARGRAGSADGGGLRAGRAGTQPWGAQRTGDAR